MERSPQLGLAGAVALLLIGGTAGTGPGKARLTVVDRTPLIVQGTRFNPSERVRIVATTAAGRAVRSLRTSVRGTFRVRFPGVSLPGCAMVSIRAMRTDGAPVALRIVPECANGPTP